MIGDGDLETIFDSGDFEIPALFTTAAGAVSVNGIFTDATEGVNLMSGQVEAFAPTIAVITSQISTVKRGHTVLIDSVNYRAARIEKIGTGMSLVHLETP